MRVKTAMLFVFLQCLGVLMFSSCQSALPQAQKQLPFTINISILDTTGYTPKDKIEDPTGKMKDILSQKPDAVVYTITPEDIEGYAWDNQFFILTKPATTQLKKAIAQRFKGDASLADQMDVGVVLDFRPFVVFINSNPIYDGQFVLPGGARIVNSPVSYLREESGQLAFVLRPFHSLAGMSGDYSSAPSDWSGIKDQRIYQSMKEAGKLR